MHPSEKKVVEESHAPDDLPTFTDSIGIEFIQIPAGTFLMGALNERPEEGPAHTVQITQPFWIGKYPVTQSQWESVIGINPSKFTEDHPLEARNRPVEQVSWYGAQAFLRRLNEIEDTTTYRLPTEAEWEYATRAGSTAAYYLGDNEEQLENYAWYSENSGG